MKQTKERSVPGINFNLSYFINYSISAPSSLEKEFREACIKLKIRPTTCMKNTFLELFTAKDEQELMLLHPSINKQKLNLKREPLKILNIEERGEFSELMTEKMKEIILKAKKLTENG